jgi:hypothetical protein
MGINLFIEDFPSKFLRFSAEIDEIARREAAFEEPLHRISPVP